jgi:rSAM/selenodomain-associated transferase 2
MAPRISIIVPTWDEGPNIGALIQNIRQQAGGAGCQIIVVDGHPQQTTLSAMTDASVIGITSAPGRGCQMNAGAKLAEGDILLFLHADTRLPDGAFVAIEAAISSGKYVGGAFGLRIDSRNPVLKLIAAGAAFRSRVLRIPYGDQGIFITKACFQDVGGFAEIPIMEDVELMRRLKKAGCKICILPPKVTTSARRWEKEGILFTILRNHWLQFLYFLGARPEKLVRYYRKWGSISG